MKDVLVEIAEWVTIILCIPIIVLVFIFYVIPWVVIDTVRERAAVKDEDD